MYDDAHICTTWLFAHEQIALSKQNLDLLIGELYRGIVFNELHQWQQLAHNCYAALK